MAFVDLLEREAIPKGLLGPNEAARLISRHLLPSVALVRFIPEGATVVDVGSGSGLPAVALACVESGVVVAIEPQKRRASFLRHAVRELGVEIDVVAARAEDAARTELRDSADVATGRALAEFPTALELTLPFVKVGGLAVLSAPAQDERRAGGSSEPVDPGEMASSGSGERARIASELGGTSAKDVRFDIKGSEEASWVTIVGKVRLTPDRYPRRSGVPQRRPLRG